MSASVEEAIAQLKEESRNLGVERELFLTGRIEGRDVTLDRAIAGSTLYQRGLILSPTQDLTEEQQELLDYAAEEIIRIPNWKGLNFLHVPAILRSLKDLSLRYSLETNNGQEEIPAWKIPLVQPQAVYFPQGIYGVSLTQDDSYGFFSRLIDEGIIGHFHTHPTYDQYLTLSKSDVFFATVFKAILDKDKVIEGVGNSEHGEKFYLI